MLEHRFTLALVGLTFVLLWIGGTVNPTGSSLACPEPTFICNGELFPAMTGGVLYEHGHRLFATTVGILQIIVTILIWRRRPSLRGLAVFALVLVCGQGALGAFTVAYKLPWIVSTLHLFTAFTYLTLLMVLAYRTRPERAPVSRPSNFSGRGWILVAATAVLLQILLGGLVRHHEATLASVSLPFHYGEIWPTDAAFAVKLQMAHRLCGVLVGLIVIAASVVVYRRARGWATVRALCVAAPLVVLAQIALGVWVIASFRSTPVAVLHFAGASMLWALFATLAIMTRSTAAGRSSLALRPALAQGGSR